MRLIDVSTKKFPNTFAMVDDEDFENLSQYSWHAIKYPNSQTKYAKTCISGKNIVMHRLLMRAPFGAPVDHRDTNGLNNQKLNLRVCTAYQNQCNRARLQKKKDSIYKGVSRTRYGGWRAEATKKHNQIRLQATFASEIEAAKAYDAFAIQLHGEFAYLNFPAHLPLQTKSPALPAQSPKGIA